MFIPSYRQCGGYIKGTVHVIIVVLEEEKNYFARTKKSFKSLSSHYLFENNIKKLH